MAAEDNDEGEPSLLNEDGKPFTHNAFPSPAKQADQIDTLKSELETLKTSVATVTAQARHLAGTSVSVAVADAEEVLKRNVFASVAIAAAVGYLWGRTR